MSDFSIFSNEDSNNVLYGKFKDTYIPLVNKEIVYNSLEFYNPNYLKGKIYKKFIRMMITIFNSKFFINKFYNLSIKKDIELELSKVKGYKYCCICEREDNINKDYILQLMNEKGEKLAYAKYPSSLNRSKFVVNEVNNLNYINSLNLKTAKVPKLILYDENKKIYIQSTYDNLKKDNGKLTYRHIEFLSELYNKTKKQYLFKESKIYNSLINISEKTKDKNIINISKKILEVLNLDTINCCYCHGDFYPPNVKYNKDFLFVYDWECAKEKFVYYDIYHYILNQNILSNKKDKKILIENVLNNKLIDQYEKNINQNKNIRIYMLILYLYELLYEFYINMNVDKEDNTVKNYIKTLNILLERIEK